MKRNIIAAVALCALLAGCSAQQPKAETSSEVEEIAESVSDVMQSEDAAAPDQAEPEAESVEDESAYDEPAYYYEPAYYAPAYDYQQPSGEGADLMRDGVVYGEDGVRFTWYSQNVLPGGGLTELNENGRTVDDGGFVVDGDGFIAVASSDYEKGTVLQTPWGEAKVYDSGCASGTVDVYTAW